MARQFEDNYGEAYFGSRTMGDVEEAVTESLLVTRSQMEVFDPNLSHMILDHTNPATASSRVLETILYKQETYLGDLSPEEQKWFLLGAATVARARTIVDQKTELPPHGA